MRKQRGFSLSEVAMGVAIVTALSGLVAGTAAMVQTQSRGAAHIERAKQLLAAADQYMMERGGFDYCKNPDNLQVYLKWGAGATPQYTYEWGRGTSGGIGRVATANASYPAGFANTDFPITNWISKGQILYFYKNNNTDNYFYVWDGRKQVTYNYYAVQVYDSKGYPMFTGGR